MDFAKKAIIVLVLITVMGAVSAGVSAMSSSSTLYTIGDIGGWNSERDVDYYDWAATKEFHVGDVLNFKYDPGFHNVVRVRRADYHACNAGNPIAVYSSGDDYIKLTGHGHYLFICGCPDHCALTGQKIDIRVPKRPITIINSTETRHQIQAPLLTN